MWRKSFVKFKPNIYKNVGSLPVSKSISKSREAYNVMTNNINHFKQIVNDALIKHSKDLFRAPTAHDMEILIQTCLMPPAIKTQSDSLKFVHKLKQEIHDDLKYVESLEKEIDELESEKAEFTDMYDVILQECVSKDVMCSYLMYLSDLDVLDELQQGLSKPVTAQTLPQTAKKAVSNTNVLKPGMYRIDNKTTHTRAPQLPQTVRNTNPRVSTSTGANHKPTISRPPLKSNQSRDKVMPNNSQVKAKKTQVEVHRMIPSVSNKIKTITACKDSLNSRTLNANAVCATCNKCLVDSNHFACVTKMLNDVHARTKKPTVVPISTRKPKSQANKTVATPNKKKIVQLILFIVDSGCTKHMTGNLKLLCNFVEKFLGTTHFGNDQFAPILGYGDLVQGNVTINRVYYVEGLNHNLFSVGQICDTDLEVAFRKSIIFVRDLQGNDLLTGNHGSDLYTISLQESTSSTLLCLMAKATPTQACKEKLIQVKGCSKFEKRLNLLHMDLCGPMRVASINKKKYILVIVDDYSRYTWTLFLRSKDEIPEVLKDFLTMIQRNPQAPVITIHYDNPDPVPQRQDVYSSVDADVPSQQELDILFGPLYDDFFNAGSNTLTNVQSTQAPSTHTNVHAKENNNDQAEKGEQFQDDEFTNPFYHPLEQVRRNPSRLVQTRQQLAIDHEMYIYALTVSTAEPKNIKEAVADSAWIEAMQEELYHTQVLSNLSDGRENGISQWSTEGGGLSRKCLLTQESSLWIEASSKGMIHQSPHGIFIKAKYTLKILHKHGMDKGQSIGTPIATKPKVDADLSGNLVHQTDYRSKIRTEYKLADMFTKSFPKDRFKYLVRRIGMRCLTPAELEVLAKESA
nr:hypothetical protein [Tanacetum cinerariifolium]